MNLYNVNYGFTFSRNSREYKIVSLRITYRYFQYTLCYKA